MKQKSFAALVLVAFLTSACTGGPKETGGALVGGAAGALIGSQFGGGTGQLAAVAVGALLGAMAGGAIGKTLDDEDKQTMAQATVQSIQTGQPMQWQSGKNPGVSGVITPVRSEGHCREYQQTVTVGGRTQKAYGKACLQADGQWKIVN